MKRKFLEYSKQNLKDLDLDKEIEESEIVRCINKLKNNKTGGGDGMVSELLKYGGVGMVKMLGKLYATYLEGRVRANEMERRTYS